MAAETGKHIEDVRNFWNSNPLFTGESHHAVGSHEYFEEHRRTVIQDCLAGQFDDRLLPPSDCRDKVLDLGCGPGFWSVDSSEPMRWPASVRPRTMRSPVVA